MAPPTHYELKIMEALARTEAKMASIETDTKLLRKELLGNGQPGRMKIAEDAIQRLQEERKFRDGMLYSINAVVTFVVASLATHGSAIWHFFFPPKH
jgi:hypothetical protein